MPNSKTVPTLLWNDQTEIWEPGPNVLISKNSFSRAQDPGDGTTQVWTADGGSIRVSQTLAQIETFLNSA